MKKLLSIFAATGLVATTGATVVSCGNKDEEVKNLTLVEGKTDADIINYLTDKDKTSILKNDSSENSNEWKPLEIEDKKLSVDYDDLDTNKFDFEEIYTIGKVTGSLVEVFDSTNETLLGSLGSFFNESKTLVNENDNNDGKKDVSNIKFYCFTVKGSKGSSTFDLRVISITGSFNIKENKYTATPVVKNEFIKTITIS
ncbi:hypothetical protein SLITO_v1c07020 [Spiroplasma litorale]|uniref:Lipoprotein n=1 Tax=Spiroplasma litorale TaxID=216942 RepID=A0A0K1W1Z2_9MOLU|nr:lipoprotein [Spiroplasma litorale]AKX34329.1 hypothetical protein SLITO_v1c07020 [Spiroplasma litorale]